MTAALGNIILNFCFERIIYLNDVLYVPIFRLNLIYVSQIFRDVYSVVFQSDVFISKVESSSAVSSACGNLYLCTPCLKQRFNIKTEQSKKRKQCSNDSYLWHQRLGHIKPNWI